MKRNERNFSLIASIKLRSPSRRRINRLSNYWNSGICLTFFTSANKGQVGPISRACRKFKAELTQRRSLLLFFLLLLPQKLLLFHQTTIIPRRLTYQKVKQPRACPSSWAPFFLYPFLLSLPSPRILPPITQLRLVNTEEKWRAEIQLQNSPSTLV